MTKVPKILIVDDQPFTIELFIKILEENKGSFTFYQALNGKTALKIAEEKVPDLIVMDWEMPNLNGIDTIKLIKKNKKTAEIPVIMSTGVMTSSHNLKTALEAGAIDFIRKPFDKIELQARVNSTLLLVNSNKKLIEQKEQILKEEADRLKKELEFKSKELISNALFITKNTQKFDRLIDDIKQLYPYLNQSGNKLLEKLIREYSFNLSQDFWTDFELHFEEIHPGFFARLQEYFSDLTVNEKKLCGFIRLNMSTKEIASVAHLNPQSINVARSRLRSKLNLDRDENLTQFIANL